MSFADIVLFNIVFFILGFKLGVTLARSYYRDYPERLTE